MPTSGTLHLITGLPCAGKSTYSDTLTGQCNGVILRLDRWLITCFGRYPVDTVGHEEHVRRVYACRQLIWETTVEFLQRGTDVILDDGFFLKADRVQHIEAARDIGANTITHHVDTPLSTIRERLDTRNKTPDDYKFEVAPAALDLYATIYETPSSEEGAALRRIDG